MQTQLPYFYEPAITAAFKKFTLSEASSRHGVQVLRMEAGDQLQLTNGQGLLLTAAIILPHKKHCEVEILSCESFQPGNKKVCIAISPTKNNGRIEWLLEKITEIGISEIWLLQCERTERSVIKWERLHHILVAALIQSRQVFLPALSKLIKFKEAVLTAGFDEKYIAHCAENDKKQILKNNHPDKSKIIFIGPEGDFSSEEIALAATHNFRQVSLGNTRLRTETAGIVAAVLLNF